MALQSSGAISFAQIQTEFGGANPIGLNEYYRGGSYVPSTRNSGQKTLIKTEGPIYTTASGKGKWWYTYAPDPYDYDTPRSAAIVWEQLKQWDSRTDPYVVPPSGDAHDIRTVSVGDVVFTKGTYQGGGPNTTPTLGGGTGTLVFYSVKREEYSSAQENINTNIPAAGALSLSNFYGGTKQ